MITLNEARALIDGAVHPLPPTGLPVADAVGCSLSTDVDSPINVPGFAASIMDGVALRYDDLGDGNGPWRLPLQATVAAGDSTPTTLAPSHAVKIMTGAPVPDGADTVVKIEDIEQNDGCVVLRERPVSRQYVRPVGDDTRVGDRIFSAGTVLTPVDAGVLASIGLVTVPVIPKPRVAVLCTGTEIVEPGRQLGHGQIYNSNNTLLQALLRHHGTPPYKTVATVADRADSLAEMLDECLNSSNLVITTGGVSMGDFDLIPEVIVRLGGEVLFHKARVKPGKPILIARLGNCWIAGLPGNPVSVAASYHLYVRRIVALLMGQSYSPRRNTAVVQSDVRVGGSRFYLLGAHLCDTDDGVIATPVGRQDSGRIGSIRSINGFIMLDVNRRELARGDGVPVEWIY